MKDFGTSKPPKSNRSSITHWCPGRPGQPAFRHNIASSLRLHTGLPYDWTPRSDAPLGAFGTSGIPCRLAATGDYPPSLHSPWRAADAQQGIFILLGSKRLSREPHPPPIPQGQPPRVGLFRCLRLCIPAGFCGKLRTSRVSQPPSPTLDSSLIAPFLSVFERVNMRRSPEVRDIPCPGTPAPGPAHR